MLFILHLSLLVTIGSARQSYWPYLGRGSKTLRINALNESPLKFIYTKLYLTAIKWQIKYGVDCSSLACDTA